MPDPDYTRDELHDVPHPDGGRIAADSKVIVRKQSSAQQYPHGYADCDD